MIVWQPGEQLSIAVTQRRIRAVLLSSHSPATTLPNSVHKASGIKAAEPLSRPCTRLESFHDDGRSCHRSLGIIRLGHVGSDCRAAASQALSHRCKGLDAFSLLVTNGTSPNNTAATRICACGSLPLSRTRRQDGSCLDTSAVPHNNDQGNDPGGLHEYMCIALACLNHPSGLPILNTIFPIDSFNKRPR